MIYENTQGVPNVLATTGSDGEKSGWWSGMWIFAIVIIFFALILIWRRDDHGYEHKGGYDSMAGIAPALAVGAMNNQNSRCCPQPTYDVCGHGHEYEHGEHERWDIERDQMREFANLRMELKETGWQQAREADRYFYENRAAIDKGFYENRTATDHGFFDQAQLTQQSRYDTLFGFKSAEVENLKNTQSVITRVDALEKRMDQDALIAKDARISHLETVLALQPKAPQPAYWPQYPMPIAQPIYAETPTCGTRY